MYPPDPDDRDIPFEGDQNDICIRCNDARAVGSLGYCGHCHWTIRAEVEDGLFQLREYLRAWARFDEWCATHETVA